MIKKSNQKLYEARYGKDGYFQIRANCENVAKHRFQTKWLIPDQYSLHHIATFIEYEETKQ